MAQTSGPPKTAYFLISLWHTKAGRCGVPIGDRGCKGCGDNGLREFAGAVNGDGWGAERTAN